MENHSQAQQVTMTVLESFRERMAHLVRLSSWWMAQDIDIDPLFLLRTTSLNGSYVGELTVLAYTQDQDCRPVCHSHC